MNEEKKVPFKWEYGEETISLQLGMYANNQRLYIGMITHTEDGAEAFADMTVNLPGYSLDPGEAFISGDISKDLLRFIKENKLGKVLPYQVQSGYGKYSAVAFDLEKLKAFDPKGVAEFREEWNLPDKKEVHHPCTFCGKEAMKMQEEVENRTLTLVVSGTKFTGRLFKAAISKYMAHCKEKKLQKQRSRDAPVTPHGKQTVKQIIGQNQGISNIEITDPSIKEFEKIARKYGVDYAVKKDRSSSPPKYLIFFKGRDADALTAAFTEYTSKKVKKAEKTERPSVLAKLSQFKEMVKNAVVDRTKRKELER